MNQQTSNNNMINPVGARLSNNDVSSHEMTCVNASRDIQSFGSWNFGESSSSSSLQNQFDHDGMKLEEDALIDHTVKEKQFEPSNILFPRRTSINISGNQVRSGPLLLQGSSSNHVQPNQKPNAGCVADNTNDDHNTGASLGPNLFNSRGLEIERASTSFASDDIGTSSGNSGYMAEEAGSGSSLGSWGLSCKRKTLEGTSGSSSCFPQAENVASYSSSPHHNASSSLSLSTPSANTPSASPSLLVMRGVHSDGFSSTSMTGDSDLLRNFGRRLSPGQQLEPLTFNLSSTGGAWHSAVWSPHQSTRPVPSNDAVDLRTTAATAVNSSASQGRSHATQTRAPSRNTHAFPWNSLSNSRSGNSSSSLLPGDRGVLQEELNIRQTTRNSAEQPIFVPVIEARNITQEPPGWSMASGNTRSSGSIRSSRIGRSSTSHHLAAPSWISNHSSTTHNHQRFSEFAPWSLFPSVESEPGPSGHFSPLSGPPASSQETLISVGSSGQNHNQSFPRSEFIMEGQGDDLLGVPRSVRALAADIEGRHRLISEIRQVLNAMRRGENMRVEDYMLFDPIVYHQPTEIHDRHIDMRLDVDNMSYEELLALEERIGNVSTGLSEEIILKSMKQKKYVSIAAESALDVEPCCICQEEYEYGNDLGMLDCGHDFHTDCIKQWLMLKNLCPICKMTALST